MFKKQYANGKGKVKFHLFIAVCRLLLQFVISQFQVSNFRLPVSDPFRTEGRDFRFALYFFRIYRTRSKTVIVKQFHFSNHYVII